MLIQFFNCGALNEATSQNITAQQMEISNHARKPDYMAAIETGNDPTKNDFRDMKFGYPNLKKSESNDPEGSLVSKEKQRNCNFYYPKSSAALVCLNVYPEINCLTDEITYITDKGRKRTTKISLIQCYRNHDTRIPVFKKWVEHILLMNFKLGIKEVVLFGDMNASSINFQASLIEIPHIGFHKHREKSKPKLIDKIFITPNLLEIGFEMQVLNSVEAIATETNGLGHKSFLLAINEKLKDREEKFIISAKKFKKNLRNRFTDEFTNRELLAKIGQTPLQPPNNLPLNNNFQPISLDHYRQDIKDPAALLSVELAKILEASKVKIKCKDKFDFDDIAKASVGRTTDAVKRFSRMTKSVLNSICSENPLLTHSIDGEEKPELEDLCSCLSTKLNKCHRGDEDFLQEFANSQNIKVMTTPTKISTAELNKAMKNIKPKKTPWILGISPSHVLEAAKISTNFKKVLLIILNMCLKEGKLATCMNHDSVIFLHKKGSRSDSSNYRPISIDHPFTKVLCEILNHKAIKNMNVYRHPLNFSYVPGKSTMSAILTASLITEEIVNRGNIPVVICTDMSGAFETCQSLLISKCLEKTIGEGEVKLKETVVSYMTEKVIFGKDKNENLIEVFREDKMIGAGQGSKVSPNLFLIQASCALYGLNRCKRTFLLKVDGEDMFLLVYADDNFSILELIPESLPTGSDRLPVVRGIVAEFMKIWEYEVSRSGMMINKTKTEVLVPDCPDDEEVYPPIKQSIKWLGMNIKMNKKGVLVGDVDKNVNMAKAKTWSKFLQLCLLTSKITVKLYTFKMFLEPVINYCLLDAITAGVKKFDKVVNRYQVLQNNFLRAIAKVGHYSKIDELHKILGIKLVADKIGDAAENEWEKVDLIRDFSPQYIETRSGKTPVIDSIKSHFWKIAESNIKSKAETFNHEDFNKWKNEQDSKRDKIAKK